MVRRANGISKETITLLSARSCSSKTLLTLDNVGTCRMIAYAVAVYFIVVLLIVFFGSKTRPLAPTAPLDDDAVPFPAAGQASSIFSLTALFGAYTGIFLLVGLDAVIGLAAGSTAALLLIRRAGEKQACSYETFLAAREGSSPETKALGSFLVIMQLGFAVSELLLLRLALQSTFSLTPAQTAVAAPLLAFIGYSDCLLGGYSAIFRTDILQLGMIVLMCIVLLIHLGNTTTTAQFLVSANEHFFPPRVYWGGTVLGSRAVTAALH